MRRAIVLLSLLALTPITARAQGNPVGPEFRVNTYTASAEGYPSVAADSSGNFVVVWTSLGQDGSSFGVFGQRYASSGTPLGPEFRVNTYTTGYQGHPDVASDASGNFVVVWTRDTLPSSGYGIFGQRYASSGTPLGPEFRVNTYTTDEQMRPSVAADPAGNLVVVWDSATQDGSYLGIFGQRYASSGSPLGPEFRVNTYTTQSQYSPSVAADSTGNFVVVWAGLGQGDAGIFGQRYASTGAPLGPEFRVNTYTTGAQGTPSVAMDPSGNFVVVWTSDTQDGSDRGVFGQRYASSGAPIDPEFRVNTYTSGTQSWPAVAADGSGNFVVAWDGDSSLLSYNVLGQRYASSGAPIGPEFRVNTYTTGVQDSPAVAADASGNFVVVWVSAPGGGSGQGIYGQRYSEIVPVEVMRFGVE